MLKYSLIAVAAITLSAATPALAETDDIKDLVPSADLAAYCTTAGIGTETTTSFTLADGTVWSGSIECEAEDLVADGEDDDLEEDELEEDELEEEDEDDSDEDSDDSDDDSNDD